MLGKSHFYKIVLFLVKTITHKFWAWKIDFARFYVKLTIVPPPSGTPNLLCQIPLSPIFIYFPWIKTLFFYIWTSYLLYFLFWQSLYKPICVSNSAMQYRYRVCYRQQHTRGFCTVSFCPLHLQQSMTHKLRLSHGIELLVNPSLCAVPLQVWQYLCLFKVK